MKNILNTGFSLVELLVSMAIVAVIMSVVLWNYSGFNDSLALNSAGQRLAIAVRQAEVYGLSVKEVGAGSGNFNSAYGIHVSRTQMQGDFILFVDKNANNVYDAGNGCGDPLSECITDFQLGNGITVSNVCDANQCPPGDARSMDITFLRPNPDAFIKFINPGGPMPGNSFTGKIILTSPKGKTLTVDIEYTGQISIQ